jgi:16S rRNA processing protein RimM
MVNLELVTIGKITKNQGNKGEVRVLPLTDYPDRFELLDTVYLVKGEETLQARIEDIRYHKNFVIIKLEGVNDIKRALELKDFFIKIAEDELLPLEEDEYYIDQITGFKVFTDEGISLGSLADVMITGGTDIFIVAGEDKEYMIPAAHEIIKEIDEDNQKIIIKPIPGLLEL